MAKGKSTIQHDRIKSDSERGSTSEIISVAPAAEGTSKLLLSPRILFLADRELQTLPLDFMQVLPEVANFQRFVETDDATRHSVLATLLSSRRTQHPMQRGTSSRFPSPRPS